MKSIGLMGCGAVADFGHAAAISRTEGLHLQSVYDPIFEKAVDLQKKYRATHAFHDLELFFNSGIDAVSVASPAPVHKQNVFDCAQRGLPVLCEKPLAMNDADSAEMILTMERAELPLAVGFCYRFSPVALKIRDLVREGAIGKVRALRLIYIWDLHGIWDYDSAGLPFYSPRRQARMDEGGPMVDCGVHQIDLARWWLNEEVVDFRAAGAWVEDHESPDHMYLHMTHESGALTTVEVSYTYGHTAKDPLPHFTYQLIGTDGVIRYDRENGLFEVRGKTGTQRPDWSYEKNFEGMYREWLHALETGDMRDMPSGKDGLIATRIARTATDEVVLRRLGLLKSYPAKEAS